MKVYTVPRNRGRGKFSISIAVIDAPLGVVGALRCIVATTRSSFPATFPDLAVHALKILACGNFATSKVGARVPLRDGVK